MCLDVVHKLFHIICITKDLFHLFLLYTMELFQDPINNRQINKVTMKIERNIVKKSRLVYIDWIERERRKKNADTKTQNVADYIYSFIYSFTGRFLSTSTA